MKNIELIHSYPFTYKLYDLTDDLIIDTISSNLNHKTFDDINIIDLDELRSELSLILE